MIFNRCFTACTTTPSSPITTTNNIKTILICEDEPDLLLTYAAMLNLEYTVIATSSGNQCLQTYIQKRNDGQEIHVILLDYKLGDMRGDEVAKAIMAFNRTTRIILISAYEVDSEIIKELLKNKIIVDFLTKPFNHNLLKKAIEIAIIGSKAA